MSRLWLREQAILDFDFNRVVLAGHVFEFTAKP